MLSGNEQTVVKRYIDSKRTFPLTYFKTKYNEENIKFRKCSVKLKDCMPKGTVLNENKSTSKAVLPIPDYEEFKYESEPIIDFQEETIENIERELVISDSFSLTTTRSWTKSIKRPHDITVQSIKNCQILLSHSKIKEGPKEKQQVENTTNTKKKRTRTAKVLTPSEKQQQKIQRYFNTKKLHPRTATISTTRKEYKEAVKLPDKILERINRIKLPHAISPFAIIKHNERGDISVEERTPTKREILLIEQPQKPGQFVPFQAKFQPRAETKLAPYATQQAFTNSKKRFIDLSDKRRPESWNEPAPKRIPPNFYCIECGCTFSYSNQGGYNNHKRFCTRIQRNFHNNSKKDE